MCKKLSGTDDHLGRLKRVEILDDIFDLSGEFEKSLGIRVENLSLLGEFKFFLCALEQWEGAVFLQALQLHAQ